MGSTRRRNVIAGTAIAVVVALAAWASPALAQNGIYWANVEGDSISSAGLAGGGGADLTPVTEPYGTAIDAPAGEIFWPNFIADKISFEKLDGSGGGDLNTAGATVSSPLGIAIDPVAGKIYWANFAAPQGISFANLNGSGGGNLTTTGATVNEPFGVTLDPASGRIYWTNFGSGVNRISFANLDGSGGADLNTGTATVSGPIGLAFDPVGDKIYWANEMGNSIAFVNADDSGNGAGTLTTTGATVSNPLGVAIDPVARKIYWANHGGTTISFANLNGSGGADLTTTPATVNGPAFPSLLEAPSAAGAPVVSGGSTTPATLTCTQGSWAPDLISSFLYRAPQSLSFSWTLNGAPIAGATMSSIAATAPGSYACTVTATNHAGSASQSSTPWPVASPPAPPPPTASIASPTASIASMSRSGTTELVTLACHGVAGQQCSVSVVGTARERKRGATILAVTAAKGKKHGGKPKTKTVTVVVARSTVTVPAGNSVTAKIALNSTAKKLVARFHRLPVKLSFTGSLTATNTVVFTLPRVHVNTPADDWFHIILPCSDCYTTANHVPITGLPAGARISVTCHGQGCPFGHKSFTPRKHQFDLAPALEHRRLQPGTTITVAITAPNKAGVVVRYTIQRGAGPLRTVT